LLVVIQLVGHTKAGISVAQIVKGWVTSRKQCVSLAISAEITKAKGFVDAWIGRIKRAMDAVPTPTTNYKKYAVGWLAPDGMYYPCDTPAQHFSLACALLKKFHPRVYTKIRFDHESRIDDELQLRGWIRVGAMMSYNFGFVIWVKPKQKQIDVIWDYCQALKREMPNLEVQ